MYIKLENNIVTEIIPDFVKGLPGVEISERYEPEFVKTLTYVSDDTKVFVGYVFKDGNYVPNVREVTVDDIVNAKGNKISELSDICTNTIYNGMDVTLSDGTVERFTLDANDQLNLSGIGLKILMGSEDIYWHENDETVSCKKYSKTDASIIISTLTTFKEYNITYFRDLRIYINSLDNIDEINNIEYGFELPFKFKSQALRNLERNMNFKGE